MTRQIELPGLGPVKIEWKPLPESPYCYVRVSGRRVETPASRATDPFSSHAAEAHINATGKRAYQQQQTAAAVRQFPGHTSQELCALSGLDRYMLARRLGDCETAGTVKRGVAQECTVTRRLALVWWPSK